MQLLIKPLMIAAMCLALPALGQSVAVAPSRSHAPNSTSAAAAYSDGNTKVAIDLQKIRGKAENGSIPAQLMLGSAYHDGDSVPRNYRKAAKWYGMAASQGSAAGEFFLGQLYALGQGVPQDSEQAMRLFRKAASQADTRYGNGVVSAPHFAQVAIGMMYAIGLGIPQSDSRALQWLHKAAAEGDVVGGYIFYWTLGFKNGSAIRWFKRMAAGGNAFAQYNLARIYDTGRGIEFSHRDKLKAAKWYRKAAKQGYPSAQYKLGLMYDNGLGVPKSLVQALKWLYLAKANGVSGKYAVVKSVESKLSDKQIQKAQALASTWWKAHH